MKYEEIETFLAVVESGSIIKAADKLYISQASASMRIKQLEEELNVKLFDRHRGHRRASLTYKGETFLPIAQQFLALWQDAMRLKDLKQYTELRIGAPDTIHLHTFNDFYLNFINAYQDISVVLKTHHSSEIHQQIDNQLCDIGFVTNLYVYPNIVSIPLYQEDMVLLYHQESLFNLCHDISLLNTEKEIFLPSSREYVNWHNSVFGYNTRKQVTVGTVLMQTQFLKNKENWMILPLSSAKAYIKDHPSYKYYHFETPPPKRVIYFLTYKYPKMGIKNATMRFINELILYIETNDSLQILYTK